MRMCRTDASGGRIFHKMMGLALLLSLAGCGVGSAVGGTVGAVAGGTVDLVLRGEAAPFEPEEWR